MEIADIQAKSKKKSKSSNDLITLEEDARLPTMKSIYDEKRYLEIDSDSSNGELKIKLFLPPYDVSDVQQGINREYQLNISKRDQVKMRKLLTENQRVITYIDGACTSNPGKAGAGVAFFASSTKQSA